MRIRLTTSCTNALILVFTTLRILTLVSLFLVSTIFKAQTVNPNYNKSLADSLGADEHGMKEYTFEILKTGPASTLNKASLDSVFGGHLKNMGRLVKEHKLIVAGPFGKNEKVYRGLFILNVQNLEEASQLLETDPAIKAKLLTAEVFL